MSRFAREAMENSLPLIRPLWMFNPRDERCQVTIYYLFTNIYTHYLQVVSDQFMVGDVLLVAPVLEQGGVFYYFSQKISNPKKTLFATPGARSRDVFLPGSPDGAEIVWKRGTDGPYYKVDI